MSDLTEGLYNPFILPALQRAGYLHSMVAAHSGDDVDDYSRRSVAPADQLEIGESWATIPYGTALDFGGIGKGYAGDALADLADGFGELQGYWFSLGGDIVSGGVDETNQPWVIDIEDTSKRDSIAARVTAPARARCAVATSSILRRKGVKNGKAWHHLIDPRTNLPARSDTETASISAPTALLADMLASCAVIVGSEQALPYIQPRGAEGALLQTKQHKKIFWGNIRHYRQTVSPSKP
jgi:thiamine biosynthesis lipoprotein